MRHPGDVRRLVSYPQGKTRVTDAHVLGRSAVPLSEHEQRLLDQIERALYAEDPKFASAVRTSDLRTVMRRRLRWAVAVFVVGFLMLLGGVTEPVVGIVGFLVMLGGLGLALSSWKRLGTSPAALRVVDGGGDRGGRTRTRRPAKASTRQRLEQRWQRRWDERGGPR